jgi:hypothetical protein
MPQGAHFLTTHEKFLPQKFVEACFGGLPEGFKEFALSEKPVPPELV